MISCKYEKPQESGVCFGIAIDKAISIGTKAEVEDDFDLQTKHLKAVITKDEKVVLSWEDMSKMPVVVNLVPGNYTVIVSTGGVRNRINAIPTYVGKLDFVVEQSKLSSFEIPVTFKGMASSVELIEGMAGLTNTKFSYFDISKPETTIIEVGDSRKVYFDTPFAFGIRIEGRLENGQKLSKNIIQIENIQDKVYHKILVK